METKLKLIVDGIALSLTRERSRVSFNDFKKRLFDEIVSSYTAHERYYHNLEHVLKVVEATSEYQGAENDRVILKLAALFHDIVYDPRASDNEQKSADRFLEITSGTGISERDSEQVKNLILLTKNHFEAKTEIEKALADADLRILGEDSDTYKKYASNIRKEYSHLSDELFYKGRLKFLRKIEKRANNETLFFNLEPIYNTRAKINIAEEILRLKHER